MARRRRRSGKRRSARRRGDPLTRAVRGARRSLNGMIRPLGIRL